jgi:hypothetical protein
MCPRTTRQTLDEKFMQSIVAATILKITALGALEASRETSHIRILSKRANSTIRECIVVQAVSRTCVSEKSARWTFFARFS